MCLDNIHKTNTWKVWGTRCVRNIWQIIWFTYNQLKPKFNYIYLLAEYYYSLKSLKMGSVFVVLVLFWGGQALLRLHSTVLIPHCFCHVKWRVCLPSLFLLDKRHQAVELPSHVYCHCVD